MLLEHESLQETPDALLDRLMREYGTKVLRLVYLFIKDRSLAEDITQDVFVKVYRHLPDFRYESSIQTWLYKIAVNECKAHMRKWSIRHIFPKARIERVSEQSVEAQIVGASERERLIAHVWGLPPAHRQIIALHYYEELEISEIASILGIREGAVRTRLHRARQLLRQSMDRGEAGEEWISTNRSNV